MIEPTWAPFAPDKHYPYSIKVIDRRQHWDWACKHLDIGTWKESYSIGGTMSTFWFVNEEDATMFRLCNEL